MHDSTHTRQHDSTKQERRKTARNGPNNMTAPHNGTTETHDSTAQQHTHKTTAPNDTREQEKCTTAHTHNSTARPNSTAGLHDGTRTMRQDKRHNGTTENARRTLQHRTTAQQKWTAAHTRHDSTTRQQETTRRLRRTAQQKRKIRQHDSTHTAASSIARPVTDRLRSQSDLLLFPLQPVGYK